MYVKIFIYRTATTLLHCTLLIPQYYNNSLINYDFCCHINYINFFLITGITFYYFFAIISQVSQSLK